jgi:hypothetical protein
MSFVSTRFLCYEAWTRQSHSCADCKDAIHPQDIDEENLIGTELVCDDCAPGRKENVPYVSNCVATE